jgi:hypothetical protein
MLRLVKFIGCEGHWDIENMVDFRCNHSASGTPAGFLGKVAVAFGKAGYKIGRDLFGSFFTRTARVRN